MKDQNLYKLALTLYAVFTVGFFCVTDFRMPLIFIRRNEKFMKVKRMCNADVSF
jgi:hypothetical protein